MNILSVPLNEISVDHHLQPRTSGIDPDHVLELEAVAEHWPPLRVVKRGDGYLLMDGFHRFAAAQNLGLDKIFVEVLEQPTDGDLYALAFALNAAHGQPLTLSDRRAFAARLLRTHSDWSDREIGRRCGLTQPTVAKVRQELEQEAHIPVSTTRVGRDGRSYPATPQKANDKPESPIDWGGLGDISSKDRTNQRRMVRYFEKLVEVLEEQDTLEGFESFEDAAQACRLVLGDEKASELAESLGWSSRNILEVAISLGYKPEPQS